MQRTNRPVARCAGDNFYGGSKISRRVAHLRETDCVAGHVKLELRNVVANYPFERSHRFAGIQPNLGHRDYSRAAALGDTQLVLDLSRRLARAVRHRGASLPDSRNGRDFAPRRVGELRDATALPPEERRPACMTGL